MTNNEEVMTKINQSMTTKSCLMTILNKNTTNGQGFYDNLKQS